jgi:hypothetical protein
MEKVVNLTKIYCGTTYPPVQLFYANNKKEKKRKTKSRKIALDFDFSLYVNILKSFYQFSQKNLIRFYLNFIDCIEQF